MSLLSLLPALALVPLAAALALSVYRRRNGVPCAHSAWLDLPDTKGLGPSVHSRVVQGYEELERSRDLAHAEMQDAYRVATEYGDAVLRAQDDWAAEVTELRAELDASRVQLANADVRIVDQWESIEELERELRAQRDAEEGIRESLWDAWQDTDLG